MKKQVIIAFSILTLLSFLDAAVFRDTWAVCTGLIALLITIIAIRTNGKDFE